MKKTILSALFVLSFASGAWARDGFEEVCPKLATENLCGSVIYCAWLNQGSCLATDPAFTKVCPALATPNLCGNVIYCTWSNAGHCVAR